jgi:hypothetical protein
MKEIKLTRGKVALVDDEDYERLNQWKWYYHQVGLTGYANRKDDNSPKKHISMHRAIMNTPDGLTVDHKDGNGCNNQKYNMRNCTTGQNSKNRKRCSTNKSGFIGVFWSPRFGGKWRTVIQVNKRKIYLGFFYSRILAAREYDRAAIKFNGEFARINGV